jgi:cytosine/adenosine deaminase-related metal-dependent hydrolase
VKTLIRARYVATMAGPILDNAGILIDRGRVAAVGRIEELSPAADARVVDYPDSVVIPGLVNAHTHLELTAVGQLPRPASFVDWVLALRGRAMAALGDSARVAESARRGVRDSLRFGVTTVGDITLNPAVTREVLRASPLRGVSFGEVLGMAGRAGQMEERIAAAVPHGLEREDLRAGIEPHAPYSLDLVGYRRCLDAARARGLPLATHLAETPDEAEFLASHTGEFRHLWDVLGGWQEGVSRAEGGPIRAMRAIGLVEFPAVLAHVNYADDDELSILARGRASVAYCPRTHAYFGHPPHRFAEMLARGINVALGTDSAASSPDLNLLDDLRLVHRLRPDVPPETIFEMATLRGARALGMADRVGSIEAGKAADLCVYRVSSREPLREVLETTAAPAQVWIRGARLGSA